MDTPNLSGNSRLQLPDWQERVFRRETSVRWSLEESLDRANREGAAAFWSTEIGSLFQREAQARQQGEQLSDDDLISLDALHHVAASSKKVQVSVESLCEKLETTSDELEKGALLAVLDTYFHHTEFTPEIGGLYKQHFLPNLLDPKGTEARILRHLLSKAALDINGASNPDQVAFFLELAVNKNVRRACLLERAFELLGQAKPTSQTISLLLDFTDRLKNLKEQRQKVLDAIEASFQMLFEGGEGGLDLIITYAYVKGILRLKGIAYKPAAATIEKLKLKREAIDLLLRLLKIAMASQTPPLGLLVFFINGMESLMSDATATAQDLIETIMLAADFLDQPPESIKLLLAKTPDLWIFLGTLSRAAFYLEQGTGDPNIRPTLLALADTFRKELPPLESAYFDAVNAIGYLNAKDENSAQESLQQLVENYTKAFDQDKLRWFDRNANLRKAILQAIFEKASDTATLISQLQSLLLDKEADYAKELTNILKLLPKA